MMGPWDPHRCMQIMASVGKFGRYISFLYFLFDVFTWNCKFFFIPKWACGTLLDIWKSLHTVEKIAYVAFISFQYFFFFFCCLKGLHENYMFIIAWWALGPTCMYANNSIHGKMEAIKNPHFHVNPLNTRKILIYCPCGMNLDICKSGKKLSTWAFISLCECRCVYKALHDNVGFFFFFSRDGPVPSGTHLDVFK